MNCLGGSSAALGFWMKHWPRAESTVTTGPQLSSRSRWFMGRQRTTTFTDSEAMAPRNGFPGHGRTWTPRPRHTTAGRGTPGRLDQEAGPALDAGGGALRQGRGCDGGTGFLGGSPERKKEAAGESQDRSRACRLLPRPGSAVPQARPLPGK